MSDTTFKSSEELFKKEWNQLFYSANRFIGAALFISWIAVVIVAAVASGKTWNGSHAATHPHFTAALYLGFLVGGLPGLLGFFMPRNRAVPYVLAVGQMLLVGLFTHISDGQIEAHFAYFGSLALLASYGEWRILILASLVAAIDHVLRGLFMPFSIFGTNQVQLWRITEHALAVAWEDVFLLRACFQRVRQLRFLAHQSMEKQQAAEAGAARVATLLRAAEELSSLSNKLIDSTKRLTDGASGSLAQARTVSEQTAVVSGKIAEMDASAKAISVTVAESSKRAAESDAAASNALSEVEKLVESSRQISEVLDTIQTLVFQTNILAINAAIEAARAGEAGKSFEVVAVEVRELAHRSRQSAETIGSRIAAIQSNVSSVGSRLAEICNSVTEISQLTSGIHESAESQAAAATTINETTSVVEQSAQRMLRSIDDLYRLSANVSEAARKTAELAESLRALAQVENAPATQAEC